MEYMRIAVTLFSFLCLLVLVGGVLLIRQGRYPRRLINLFLASACGTAALLFLLVDWPWVAIPWAMSVPMWLWAAIRYS